MQRPKHRSGWGHETDSIVVLNSPRLMEPKISGNDSTEGIIKQEKAIMTKLKLKTF